MRQLSISSKVLFAFVLVLLSAVFALKYLNVTIAFNKSESLPYSFFVVDLDKKEYTPKRGDIVQFSFINRTEPRFFGNGVKMIKVVAGVPGDEVLFKGREFYINGELAGEAKAFSKNQKELWVNKSKVLSNGEYFLLGSNPDSYDSRYLDVGYVKREQIIGKSIYKI